MEKPKKKMIYLTDTELGYIEELMRQRRDPSFSSVIREIIHEHKNFRASSPADAVWDAFERRYGRQITRIRLGVNTADRNSQVIIKLLNSFFLENGNTVYTDVKEGESIYLMNAKEELKKEIARYKQLKDEREARRRNGVTEED